MFLILVFVLLLIHYYNNGDEAYDHTLSFTNLMDRFVSLLVIFLAIDIIAASVHNYHHDYDYAKLHHQQQITALKYEIKLTIGSSSSSMLPPSSSLSKLTTTANASPLMTTDELLSKMKQYTETTNYHQESLTTKTTITTTQDIMNVLYEYCQNDSTLSCYSPKS